MTPIPLTLTPRDFARCRAAWAKRFGPDRLAKFILAVRGMFKWARRPPLRLSEPDYGDEFDPPAKLVFRRRRNADRAAHGPRLFTAAEVKALLAKANRNMRAMILLALNGGFGNTDLAELPRAAIDLDDGWIDYARGKTGMQRRVPLWPETVKAVRAVLDYRPKSRKRPNAPPPTLLFVTRQSRAYVEDRQSAKGRPLHKDRISTQFNLLCAAAGVARFRRGFYSLRRTHRSLTDEAGDQRAAALLMGHELPDIGGVYVQRISDERLKALTGHVRTRPAAPPAGAARAARARAPLSCSIGTTPSCSPGAGPLRHRCVRPRTTPGPSAAAPLPPPPPPAPLRTRRFLS
jgi:integrase